MMKRIWILFPVVIWGIMSCKSQPEGYFESSNLPGMIYDADNRPCNKVSFLVHFLNNEGKEEEVARLQSDINGRFTIPGLQRGAYRILGSKSGYESIETELFYSSRLDVLYLKILSQKQILNMATDALNERRFRKAEQYILRSEQINRDDPYSLYMKSVFLYEKKMFADAVLTLNRIVEQGFQFAYVHLLLADLYQFKLNDRQNALNQLEVYLNLIDDSEVELRKQELEKNEI